MKLSSNVVSDFNDANNFPHALLLTNTQIPKLSKAFVYNSSAKIKLSKTQMHKIGQSGGFLVALLEWLPKTGLPLIKNALKLLAKSILIPLELTAAVTATTGIHKKMFGSGTTTVIVSNEEINDIMKIVKSLEESGLVIKGISETIKNKAKE